MAKNEGSPSRAFQWCWVISSVGMGGWWSPMTAIRHSVWPMPHGSHPPGMDIVFVPGLSAAAERFSHHKRDYLVAQQRIFELLTATADRKRLEGATEVRLRYLCTFRRATEGDACPPPPHLRPRVGA